MTILTSSLSAWFHQLFKNFKDVCEINIIVFGSENAKPLVSNSSNFGKSIRLSICLHHVADYNNSNRGVSVSADRILAHSKMQQRKTHIGDDFRAHVVLLKKWSF